ncbi:hypothetical protein QJQ45_017204 [Haematococcus lacustris]|nr:hypothetical protein QJQ45_017204 [Haematococcus lacustris]
MHASVTGPAPVHGASDAAKWQKPPLLRVSRSQPASPQRMREAGKTRIVRAQQDMECDQHQAAASPAAAAAHLREERQWLQHPLPSPAVQAVRRQQEQQWGGHCGHTTQVQGMRSLQEDCFTGINDLTALAQAASASALRSHASADPPGPSRQGMAMTNTHSSGAGHTSATTHTSLTDASQPALDCCRGPPLDPTRNLGSRAVVQGSSRAGGQGSGRVLGQGSVQAGGLGAAASQLPPLPSRSNSLSHSTLMGAAMWRAAACSVHKELAELGQDTAPKPSSPCMTAPLPTRHDCTEPDQQQQQQTEGVTVAAVRVAGGQQQQQQQQQTCLPGAAPSTPALHTPSQPPLDPYMLTIPQNTPPPTLPPPLAPPAPLSQYSRQQPGPASEGTTPQGSVRQPPPHAPLTLMTQASHAGRDVFMAPGGWAVAAGGVGGQAAPSHGMTAALQELGPQALAAVEQQARLVALMREQQDHGWLVIPRQDAAALAIRRQQEDVSHRPSAALQVAAPQLPNPAAEKGLHGLMLVFLCMPMRPQVASMRQALAKFHSAPNNPVCQAVQESMEAMRSPSTSTTLQVRQSLGNQWMRAILPLMPTCLSLLPCWAVPMTDLQAIHQATEDPFRGWVAPGPRLGGSQLHSPTHQSRALPLLA